MSNLKFLFGVAGILLCVAEANADYGSCKRSCADQFRYCIANQSSISPEECAATSNSCLYDCQRTSTGGSSGSVTRDISSCRPVVESAVNAAMNAGKSDSEIMQAGSAAQDRCMHGKGY